MANGCKLTVTTLRDKHFIDYDENSVCRFIICTVMFPYAMRVIILAHIAVKLRSHSYIEIASS